MKIKKQKVLAAVDNIIYFQCPACQTKALVDVDNEVRRLLDVDYQDRFVCEECGEEFLGEVGYDLKPKFTKIADNVESATNTCGIAARPDQLKKLEDEVVSAATPPYRKREIIRSLQDKLINRCAKWFRDDFGHMDDSELAEFLPELGYNDLNDMFVVEVTLEDDGRIRAEVRAELSYDGLYDLGEACNPIVQKYDKEAYFDMDQPGIMSAYLDLDGVYGSTTNKINFGSGKYKQSDSDVESSKSVSAVKNYGGAYDIDPESYFTREDLDELGYSVAELVSLDLDDTVEYAGAWIEPNNELTVELKSTDYDSSVTLKVDMRKIRRPQDLTAKYAQKVADESIKQFKDWYQDEEAINSSEAIDAQYRSWYEPDDDDYIDVDEVEDVVEIDLDGTQVRIYPDQFDSTQVRISPYQFDDFVDKEHKWAKYVEIEIPDFNTWVTVPSDQVEDDVWDMIADMLPEPTDEEEIYTLYGEVRLCYRVSNVFAEELNPIREPEGDYGYNYETYTDDAEIEFIRDKSQVVSLRIE